MPWMVGIDEAGYGPNLGPFVMASVACRLPCDAPEPDLWQILKGVVRRPKEREDGRLLIEDSKVVYSSGKGLKALERGVLAPLLPAQAPPPLSLADWIHWVAPAAHGYLREECWYTGRTTLPLHADHGDLCHSARRFHDACRQAGLAWGEARSVVVCPSRFNGILERAGTKSVVLMLALAELLRQTLEPDDTPEAVFVVVDKHGGRNNYAELLQVALPEGQVVVAAQGAECSSYRIEGMSRDYGVIFRPRAESTNFCVALASMQAKYLRELFMHEFNAFWRQHRPELKPTAGYPTDAARFMDAIRPVAAQLGIAESALWRNK